MHPRLSIRASAGGAEVSIYQSIGEWGITAKDFAEQLKPYRGQALTVRIHSDGGSVFDGLAIYNALKRHEGGVIVEIDGIAASIASVIALAGDKVRIAANGYIMIHEPWGIDAGTATDFRDEANLLEKLQGTMADIYAERTGTTTAQAQAWMAAETWFTAKEALAAGLVDEITPGKQIAAKLNLSKFKNPPKAMKPTAADSDAHDPTCPTCGEPLTCPTCQPPPKKDDPEPPPATGLARAIADHKKRLFGRERVAAAFRQQPAIREAQKKPQRDPALAHLHGIELAQAAYAKQLANAKR